MIHMPGQSRQEGPEGRVGGVRVCGMLPLHSKSHSPVGIRPLARAQCSGERIWVCPAEGDTGPYLAVACSRMKENGPSRGRLAVACCGVPGREAYPDASALGPLLLSRSWCCNEWCLTVAIATRPSVWNRSH